jgi:hypothetical protein
VVAPVSEHVAAAPAAVPWPADLDALMQRGRWVKHVKAADGDSSTIDALVYSRCWPDFTGDALLIRSETDASAVRLDADGYQVWARTGGAREVVDALRELPDPGRPHAPHLARGQAALPWLPSRELGR